MMFQKAIRRSFGRLLRLAGAIALFAVYCTYAALNDKFPAPQINKLLDLLDPPAGTEAIDWRVTPAPPGPRFETINAGAIQPGLVLIAGNGADGSVFAKAVTRDGEAVQSWNPDFTSLWPDTREDAAGWDSILEGAQLLENGDLIFNFSHHSTVRLDACGNPRWKLDNRGHDNIFVSGTGNIWVAAEQDVPETGTGHLNIGHDIVDDIVQEISPSGTILRRIRVLDLLRDNDLLGLIYLSSIEDAGTTVSGDLMHLSDVEVYAGPAGAGPFEPGDVLLSLRNISTVLVFDPDTGVVKYHLTGHFLRQGDVDFTADGKIVVFDNRNLDPAQKPEDPGSRVILLDTVTGQSATLFQGNQTQPFYTSSFGQVQQLENGNLLVTSSIEARAFEVTSEGTVAWQFSNKLSDMSGGLVTSAEVLPAHIDAAFFASAKGKCSQ